MRGKGTYGGWSGQRVEEQGTWASRTRKHSEAGYGRPVDRGEWTAKTVKRPRQQPAQPQYANYWAPLTRKRHTMSHPAQPRHTNHWALRTRKRHQQEHRPSGRQKAATRRNRQREERVTVQGPVKKQQPDEMSHRGLPLGFPTRLLVHAAAERGGLGVQTHGSTGSKPVECRQGKCTGQSGSA